MSRPLALVLLPLLLAASVAAAAPADSPPASAKPAAKPTASKAATSKPATEPGASATLKPAAPAAPAWVQKSNTNAMAVLGAFARLQPEAAGRFGMTGYDKEIFDLKPGFRERLRGAFMDANATLAQRYATEQDPAVKADLGIMMNTVRMQLEGDSLEHALLIPYFDLSGTVFRGVRTLLDDRVAADRRPAALDRVKRYAGLEPGYTPIATLARDYIRTRLSTPGLVGPSKDEIENDLRNATTYYDGMKQQFEKFKIAGYEQPLATLRTQLEGYEAFVKDSILPRARADFRQPPALYAEGLEQYGVDMPVPELVSRAEVSFKEIQNQMRALAPLVAKEKGFTSTDYRDVIRELKKKQLVGDAILPHYQARLKDVEAIIRREGIVTLPARDCVIRLAEDAETATVPAPHLDQARIIGNTGEPCAFVLPLHVPKAGGALDFDDFTFEAASWTLTAHEARPGHELQFSGIAEKGVSIARALFAFNSVNAEGWGLYAEAEMQPYEPLDGQLITLQHRLMRAARAFIDPGMQAGTISKEQAMRILQNDVVLSEAMATQEVERYMFRGPGQATSYFVGYCRLLEIRAEAERALGAQFDRHKFHDFVIAQGLLPPALLKKAVMEEFVPSQRSTQTAGGATKQ